MIRIHLDPLAPITNAFIGAVVSGGNPDQLLEAMDDTVECVDCGEEIVEDGPGNPTHYSDGSFATHPHYQSLFRCERKYPIPE